VEFNVIQSISATVDVVGTCQSTVGAPVNCYRPTVIEALPVMLYTVIKVITQYSTIFFIQVLYILFQYRYLRDMPF